MFRFKSKFSKWLAIGIGVKRWLVALLVAGFWVATAFAVGIVQLSEANGTPSDWLPAMGWLQIALMVLGGLLLAAISLSKLSRNLLAPYRRHQHGRVIDVVYAHSKRHTGLKVVAIGGGTGLPSVLRGLKVHTSNITAIVTVADDGGSSGRLRREMGVLPPGDMRNNIAALADDEGLMTQLFQHRFQTGALQGHAFGNIFIAALEGISGGVETALPEVERILNIQGRVLPSTLADVNLVASVKLPNGESIVPIHGESKISSAGGKIHQIGLTPPDVEAFNESVHSIIDADLIVIGPGSLYTSILPNLLVSGITEALRTTRAYKTYVCNVATQPGETQGYNVADHVLALENHIGRGLFQTIIANNARPNLYVGDRTVYVDPIPANHDILQRYDVRYTVLTDGEQPWRHDPHKLAGALLNLIEEDRVGFGDAAKSTPI